MRWKDRAWWTAGIGTFVAFLVLAGLASSDPNAEIRPEPGGTRAVVVQTGPQPGPTDAPMSNVTGG